MLQLASSRWEKLQSGVEADAQVNVDLVAMVVDESVALERCRTLWRETKEMVIMAKLKTRRGLQGIPKLLEREFQSTNSVVAMGVVAVVAVAASSVVAFFFETSLARTLSFEAMTFCQTTFLLHVFFFKTVELTAVAFVLLAIKLFFSFTFVCDCPQLSNVCCRSDRFPRERVK